MTKKMLINTIDEEESRMAIIEDGKLVEFNIRMSVKEPTTGNIYKAKIQKVEPGLHAAFVDYGAKKSGFLPLRDVSAEYFQERKGKLAVGKELLVQVLREGTESKGAMLTTYISLPGRYLVLMPVRNSAGVSRKIEDEEDRKRLKTLMEQICEREKIGFIIRTAGMGRTKQELTRDYQMQLRLWKDIQKKAEEVSAPALVYQESDFAVRSFRDFYTSDISEILLDNAEAYKKMKAYCKAVSPRNVKMVKLYRDDIPIFDKYNIEDQINEIYQERVNLKSGGYTIITPTEALITIDVNSGRASNKKDVEETAFRTNIEAAREIARQLRLRDLGGLIVIDFIDMRDRDHIKQVERTFRDAVNTDRVRIQMASISRFGLLELSRQKKQSTIQEISYAPCPHCNGTGVRPSVEYMALSVFRKFKSYAVKGLTSSIRIVLPYEVCDYLLNQKRAEIVKMESMYRIAIHISGSSDMVWGQSQVEVIKKVEDSRETAEKDGAEVSKKSKSLNGKEEGKIKREPARRRRGGRRKVKPEEEVAEVRPEENEDANPVAVEPESETVPPIAIEEETAVSGQEEKPKREPARRRRGGRRKTKPVEPVSEIKPEAGEDANPIAVEPESETVLPIAIEEETTVSAQEEKPKREPARRRRGGRRKTKPAETVSEIKPEAGEDANPVAVEPEKETFPNLVGGGETAVSPNREPEQITFETTPEITNDKDE